MTADQVSTHSRASRKVGLPPGSLVYLGKKRVDEVKVSIIDYDASGVRETDFTTPDECRQYINSRTVTWINVTGLHDTELLSGLGDVFGFHPLVLEDILNTGQRPKLEEQDDYIFCVLQMLHDAPGEEGIVSEQVSMILGSGYLFTFQEMEGDVFDMLRERIRSGKGRIRKMGCDYLAYAIMDAMVDNYFVILEQLGQQGEQLQEDILENAQPETLATIHRLRRESVFMKKHLWPLREVVAELEKTESKLVHRNLAPYLRDVYEHTIQVIDGVESLRDLLSGSLDIYMTVVSNRMNEVMKVLTIIATIFIPLGFIAGLYGMNFENMPELKFRFGYYGALLAMAAIAGGMLLYFRRKKWL